MNAGNMMGRGSIIGSRYELILKRDVGDSASHPHVVTRGTQKSSSRGAARSQGGATPS